MLTLLTDQLQQPLASADRNRDIQMYINSPGGFLYTQATDIYDTMQIISPEVATICTSMAASSAPCRSWPATKGKRTALKHARVMIHQPHGGAEGQTSDIEITAREFVKLKKELNEIIASHSGQSVKRVKRMATVTTG